MSSALTRLLDQTMNVGPSEMFLETIGCPISLESIRRNLAAHPCLSPHEKALPEIASKVIPRRCNKTR